MGLIRKRNPTLSKRIDEATALDRWSEAVGPQIAKRTRALYVRESQLWVEVDHPAWKNELHFRKKQILEKLNAKLPNNETLKNLVFVEPTRPKPRPFQSR